MTLLKKSAFIATLLTTAFSMPCPAVRAEQADSLTGRDIAYRSQYRPSYKTDECTALEMKLVNAQGDVRTREFLRYQGKSLKDGKTIKTTMIKFWHPEDIKDTGTYNEEVPGGDDIQYLYLPAALKLRRITAKDQSWVGSDFVYEDLQEINFDAWRYELLRSDVFDGKDCWVYSMVPIKSETSIYGKQVRWATKKDYLPVKVEYYKKDGSLFKILEATDFRDANGIPYAWKISLRNVEDKHETRLTRRWIFLDTDIDKDVFTTRYMQKSIDFYNHPADLWTIWKKAISEKNKE